MRRLKTAPRLSADRERLDALAAVSARFGKWKPAAQVLTEVKSVPTIFVQVDGITKVCGWPIERVSVIHGESNEGKTELALGLGLSFLRAGHFFGLVDAERTTPARWLRQLMAAEVDHPAFVAIRQNGYEEIRAEVRRFCETIGEARAKNQIAPDTTGLVAVDSLRKLVPKRLFDELVKSMKADAEKKPALKKIGKREAKPKGIDGMGGRGAQYKAALNAAWFDELVPLLCDTMTAIVVIAREYAKTDAGLFDFDDFVVGGGASVNYEASMRVRVTSGGYVTDAEKNMLGERHVVEVRKTKVGKREERIPRAHYHTSNGVLVPEGFDRARDVLEAAQELGMVKLHGSHFYFGRKALGQGENQAVKRLYAEPDLLGAIERDVRTFFAENSA